MDLAHEYLLLRVSEQLKACFNPCFNGSCSRMKHTEGRVSNTPSFNPCFNGSCSRICSRMPIAPLTSAFNAVFQSLF
jgi:hypothetical protein